MLQLRPDQIEQLDVVARQRGASRSSLVRDAVDASLRPLGSQAVAELYAAAYPEPVAGTDEWGDLDAWHTAAATARVAGARDAW